MRTLFYISEICSMIERLNSCNLLAEKVAEKFPRTIYRPDKKKRKKYQKVRNELFIKDNIKALKYKSCISFRACQENFFEFTYSAHTMY